MILSSTTTTATATTNTPDLGQTNPALPAVQPAQAAQIGQRAPGRVRLLPAAPVTTPLDVVAQLTAQDALWRAQAVRLAHEHDATCAATWLGLDARGQAESYRVRAAQRGSRFYRVSFLRAPDAVTVEDGRWLCECAHGRRGLPCQHVGSAALLANRRAIVRESLELAALERMGWAHATPRGRASALVSLWHVGRPYGSRWDYLTVAWDVANNVAVWCDCGALGPCPHVGAVALRVARDARQTRETRQVIH